MDVKNYVTKEEGMTLAFGYDYKQCFDHEPKQGKTMPEYVLVKDFLREPYHIKQVTLEVLKFLYQFTFASYEQLQRMLELKDIDSSDLKEIIQDLIENRKMNSFYLDRFAMNGEAPDDAFVIYCLDFGAVSLLKHFSESDCITWWSTDAVRSAELIQKYLTTVRFYLELFKVQGKSLRYFKPIFDVTFGHRYIRFSGVFEIKRSSESNSHTFIVEAIRNYDLPVNWQEKVDEKITPFSCQEQNWKKYFSVQEPVYLLLCEDEKQALEAADLLYRRTGKENFRLITDDQVQEGLDRAVFLKYCPDQTAPENMGTLVHVKSTILSGEHP